MQIKDFFTHEMLASIALGIITAIPQFLHTGVQVTADSLAADCSCVDFYNDIVSDS